MANQEPIYVLFNFLRKMTKKSFNLRNVVAIAICLAGVTMFSGCGGSGSGSGNVKNNEYLGALPKIYVDYQLAKAKNQEKSAKLGEISSIDKRMKEAEKLKNERNEIEEKRSADAKAEIHKLVGKEIPFSHSKNFVDTYPYEVTSAKINEDGCIALSVVAKQDFTLQLGKNYAVYKEFFFRSFAKDGSSGVISACYLMDISWNGKSFTKGQSIGNNVWIGLHFETYAEKLVDFAGIEFITKEEYSELFKNNQ